MFLFCLFFSSLESWSFFRFIDNNCYTLVIRYTYEYTTTILLKLYSNKLVPNQIITILLFRKKKKTDRLFFQVVKHHLIYASADLVDLSYRGKNQFKAIKTIQLTSYNMLLY